MVAKKSITIHDVAREAGVSVSTVSRVLNDKDDVARETYDRVQTIIDELGYSSSLAARSMRSRKTNVIGLIMPDVEDSFSIMIIQGVNQAIMEAGYDLMIYTSADFQRQIPLTKEHQYIALLNGGITDGVIIFAPATGNFSSPSPVVSIDTNIVGRNTPLGPTVLSTNYQGAFQAVRYLIDQGHRRIGFIGGRADLQSARRREKAYRDALALAEIEIDETLIVNGDFTRPTARKCAEELLNLSKLPTAVFGANDQSAIGFIQVATERGLQIPDDISLVGFDNLPEAEMFGLTTVDQHVREMGYEAGRLLVSIINEEVVETNLIKIETDLVIRNTVKQIDVAK